MQSEIPDDVMKAARSSTVAYFNSFGAYAEADAVSNKDRDHWGEVQSAAWAIMAERERCKAALPVAEPVMYVSQRGVSCSPEFYESSPPEPSVAVKALRDDRRMLVSHATMGRTDGDGQSVNDICVTITKLRNELYEEARKSALTAQVQDVAVPEGWQLVPKEPTYKMLLAGSFVDWGKYPDKKEAVRDVWNAMNRNADNSAAPAKQEG